VLNKFVYFLPSAEYIFILLTIWLSFCLGDFCWRLLHVTALTPTALNPLCRLQSTSALKELRQFTTMYKN